MRKESNPAVSGAGFSLLELLMVLAVMGILLGAAVPGVKAVRHWLARIESEALFGELQTACRLLHLEQGGWPAGLVEAEVFLNEVDTEFRADLSRHMETALTGNRIRDGQGNERIYLVLDLDGDRWIRAEDFSAMAAEDRPEAVWSRTVVYSLDAAGRLAFRSW